LVPSISLQDFGVVFSQCTGVAGESEKGSERKAAAEATKSSGGS